LGEVEKRGFAAHWLFDEVRRREPFDMSNGARRHERFFDFTENAVKDGLEDEKWTA
jgi:hypothetical protein